MSAGLVSLPNATVYDFTSSLSQCYGNDEADLGGVYGMYTGDGDGDGQVISTDFNEFFPKFQTGASGYEMTDWNMNGFVTSSDFNVFFTNFTLAKITHVP